MSNFLLLVVDNGYITCIRAKLAWWIFSLNLFLLNFTCVYVLCFCLFYYYFFIMWSYFRNSTIFSVLCLMLWFYLWFQSGWVSAGFSTMFIVFVLGVLETSISFDNAIVNVGVLKKMDSTRRHRFLTWWILIAVVGMRVIFPLLIVAIFGKINPLEALQLAISDTSKYSEILHHAHIPILWFGWAFLMMVGLKYFFNPEKDVHRLGRIEKYLTKIWKMQAIEAALVLIMLYIFSSYVAYGQWTEFFMSGVMGVVLYILVDGMSSILESDAGHIAKSSAMAFVYLEILDASFSLDGVIGAFALSSNLFVIALGLWIGAYFVRSMTIYLFEKWTLNTYRFLENGAFRAICLLALMMFLGSVVHIPEVITGLIGVVVIWLSIISSLKHKS